MRMERQTNPNLWDISNRVRVELVFTPRRRHGLSVPAW